MLSMLGWAGTPHHFPKKAQVKPQQVGPTSPVKRQSAKGLIAKLLQNFVLGTPRGVAVQYTSAHTGPAFSYSVSGSYVLSPSYSHAGHPVATPATSYVQTSTPPYGQPQAPPVSRERTASTVHHGGSNSSPPDARRSFKIYPDTHNPHAFIYERSEDAQSETMTSYSSSTGDSSSIYSSTTATSSTMSQGDYGRDAKRLPASMLAGPSRDARLQSALPTQTSHRQPPSLPTSSNPPLITRENSNLRGIEAAPTFASPPGRGSDPGRRRGSNSSDSDDTATRSARPNVLRKSPPRADSGVQFPRDGYSSDTYDLRAGYTRVVNGMATPGASREAPPLHHDDSHIDMQRARRMSGVPPLAAIRERTSPVEVPSHDFRTPATTSTAVVLRSSPSRDRSYYTPLENSKERISPDRDRFAAEPVRERRLSSAGSPMEASGYFDRPALTRHTTSASSRGCSSPPDEPPHAHVSKPIPIRARTLSKSEILRGLREPDVAIVGVEPVPQSRSVRFSENLICPSPIPKEKRRKGWFNKRGDQLWTNDGGYVRPETPDDEYPPDLKDYPEPGTGWMNEEGIRIDIEHRLIPKVPLRPALKRSSMSGSSSGTMVSLMRVEHHTHYANPSIREEM